MSEILCPECQEDMHTLTPHVKEDDKNILRMFCAKCRVYKEVDKRDYEWSWDCPFCGRTTYDPRGKGYREILTRSLGQCGDDCIGRKQKQSGLKEYGGGMR